VIGLILLFCSLFIVLFVPRVQSQDTLKLGIHPYLVASDLYKRFTPLAEYLSRETGKKVVIEIASNYEEHIEKIGRNLIDIAYMGPASYVKLVETYGKKPILAAIEIDGKKYFYGVIIALKSGTISSLNDLKGKRFAFGDPHSTMSHLVPRYMLWKVGIGIDDLGGHTHLSNHDNVALAVLTGNFDAGAVKMETYQKYEKRGLKVIAATPDIHEHVFVASNALTTDTVRTLREAFIQLKDRKEGEHIMSSIKKNMTAMGSVYDGDYDNLRKILNALKELGVEP